MTYKIEKKHYSCWIQQVGKIEEAVSTLRNLLEKLEEEDDEDEKPKKNNSPWVIRCENLKSGNLVYYGGRLSVKDKEASLWTEYAEHTVVFSSKAEAKKYLENNSDEEDFGPRGTDWDTEFDVVQVSERDYGDGRSYWEEVKKKK